MRLLKFSISITLIIILSFCNNANAESLKNKIHELKILQINYGGNNFKVNSENILIMKGLYETGTSGSSDIYTVFIKQKKDWQMVRMEEGTSESIINIASPFYEQSLNSLRFMIPKNDDSSKNISTLYLIKAKRSVIHTNIDAVPVVFTLFKLSPENDEFGTRYFNQLTSVKTKAKYCGVEESFFHELNIATPNGENYNCP